jgi:hypothetical protein
LDWTDILINVIVLAILPGVLGALGGHLAAEALEDKKSRRKIKWIFWVMCVVWIALTGWQQFRAAEADLDRSTKDAWGEALAANEFLPPPPPVIIERGHEKVSPADVALEFAGREGLQFLQRATTATTAREQKTMFAMVDTTNCFVWPGKPDDCQPLPLTTQTRVDDYINGMHSSGPYAVLDQSSSQIAVQHVKTGDAIVGTISFTCINCTNIRRYYVYFRVGEGGWFYPVPVGKQLPIPMPKIKTVPDSDLQQFLDQQVPKEGRLPIS